MTTKIRLLSGTFFALVFGLAFWIVSEQPLLSIVGALSAGLAWIVVAHLIGGRGIDKQEK